MLTESSADNWAALYFIGGCQVSRRKLPHGQSTCMNCVVTVECRCIDGEFICYLCFIEFLHELVGVLVISFVFFEALDFTLKSESVGRWVLVSN